MRNATLLAFIFLAVSMVWSGAGAADKISVSSVRLGAQGPGVVRIVLDVDSAIEPVLSVLPDPYRLVVDLPAADWPSDTGQGEGQGLVSRYRYGLFSPTQSRLVLDLKRPAVVKKAFLLQPSGQFSYRYVIDIVQSDRAAFLKLAKSNKPVEHLAPPVTSSVPEARDNGRRPVVVIDAGHGGHDPGTSSKLGYAEKNIALSAAKELAAQLRATGRYTVILTRETDVFIPLERRPEIARKNKADLFISMHADAIQNPNLTGGTVYTLSERASDAQAAALAAKENKADIIAGVDLNGENEDVFDILLSLAQRETMNYSAGFATMLVEELGAQKLIPRRPHRFAGFVVLKAADVPSVLIEMGYLSNNTDARRLASKQGQRDIARAVTKAVNRYFDQRLAQQF